MAVRKDYIVFVTMLLTLEVAYSIESYIATRTDIEANTFWCNGINTSRKLVACFDPERFSDNFCETTYLVRCVGDPCNDDNSNFVAVIMVGRCISQNGADIQLSADAYDLIVRVKDSASISVNFVPVVDLSTKVLN